MALEDWFKLVKTRFNNTDSESNPTEKHDGIPKNILFKCPRCQNVVWEDEIGKFLFRLPTQRFGLVGI